MSRLDVFILRMQAQRACIDEAAAHLKALPGSVLEVGLGNGRTYDHLRQRFTKRDIFVFDREVAAHPDCVPEAEYLRLGDFRISMPAFAQVSQLTAAFIHADIGSANRTASTRLAADLAPFWLKILAPGAYLACDQQIDLPGLLPMALPVGASLGAYFFFRKAG